MTDTKKPKVTQIPPVSPPFSAEPNEYPDTPENRQMAVAIERVLRCPVSPSHHDLSNWSIGSLIVAIQTLQADLLNTSNPDLRLRVARELASLHKSLHQWSADVTTQTKGGK